MDKPTINFLNPIQNKLIRKRRTFMERTKIIASLTKRELEIMTILWNSPNPLIASEIASPDSGLTINTVQAILRKLLKNKLIAIHSIVHSNTVLCRSYKPLLSKQEFALLKLSFEYQKVKDSISLSELTAFLLDTNSDKEQTQKDLIELKELLESYTEKETF